jgi:hypothetical protein
MDAMGLGPEAVSCCTSAGGRRPTRLARFEAGFERLSERRAARLVIENDDRTFALGTCSSCTRAPACASSGTSSTTTATTRTGSRTARRSSSRSPPGRAA